MPTLTPLSLRRSLILRFLDALLVLGALAFIRPLHPCGIDDQTFNTTLVAVLGLVLVVFHAAGAYQVLHLGGLGTWCSRALWAWAWVLALFFAGLYAFKAGEQFPRLVVGPWVVAVSLGLLISRCAFYLVMVVRHKQGRSGHQVLLAGEHAHCRRLARHIAQNPALGLHVVGIFTDLRRGDGRGDQTPVLGPISGIATYLQTHPQMVDRVVVAAPLEDQSSLLGVMKGLARHPVVLQYAPNLARFNLVGFQAMDYQGQPVFNITASPLDGANAVVKWLEDKILALLILILISPVLLAVAIAVKLSSPGPIFFVQERHGMYGRPIRVFKFRSMRMPRSADEQTAILRGRESTPSGRFKQATTGDDRVTAVGRFIRRTSLDELPQFLNVLKGDMSIVGPRPHPIGLNLQYIEAIEELMRRHYVKPGITGLAQVSGARGETRTVEEMRKRIQYDLEYVRNWSLLLDLKIIFLTVFRGFVNAQP